VARWTCPHCSRTFGRARQGHLCIPGTTVEEWFADEPPEHLAIHEEIVDHLAQLGDVVVEPVAVGVFYKRGRTFAELRPRYDHLVLSVLLPRKVDSPRFSRKPAEYGRRVGHWVPLRGPDDVDEEVRGWLTESFLDCPEP
jgi:Domain of unknown function (DUF5655)